MNAIGWVSLFLSLIGAVLVAGKGLSIQLTRLIVIATQVQEQVKLSLVGIEALRMVDTDTTTKIEFLERRVDDLERYMQISTATEEHPFIIRFRDK